MSPDFRLLSHFANHLEKAGELEKAWVVVAELASGVPPQHPLHRQLLQLEQRIQERNDNARLRKPPSATPQ